MAEIVNLRMARKVRKRAEKEQESAANRAKYGRSKFEKRLAEQEHSHTDRVLDGAKRDPQ